jgi:hypothetical protein
MNNKEQEPKKFMTMSFLGSKMILSSLTEYSTDTETLDINKLKEELVGQKVFSSIKNGALNNALKKLGIEWESIEKIQAGIGDIIYEVRVAGLKNVFEYSDCSELPGYCTLVPQRITVYKK